MVIRKDNKCIKTVTFISAENILEECRPTNSKEIEIARTNWWMANVDSPYPRTLDLPPPIVPSNAGDIFHLHGPVEPREPGVGVRLERR